MTDERIHMKRIITAVIVAALTIFAFVSCGKGNSDGKMRVITTLFPQYDMAKIIAGDKAEVTMLLPWGIESHTYDPSVKDMTEVANADIFIYTGSSMEPWAATLLENAQNKQTTVVDLSENITLLGGTDEDEHDHGHDYDPHIWTSPKNAIIMVDDILSALCSADQANSEYYIKNAQDLKNKISALDAELAELSQKHKGRTLYFGGRFAFLYMFTDYGFEFMSPYHGCSDEAEPGIKTVTEVCNAIKNDGAKYIFTEEMSESKVAKGIADETDTKLLVLHSCHNLSKNEAEKGESYVSVMTNNIKNLRLALEG